MNKNKRKIQRQINKIAHTCLRAMVSSYTKTIKDDMPKELRLLLIDKELVVISEIMAHATALKKPLDNDVKLNSIFNIQKALGIADKNKEIKASIADLLSKVAKDLNGNS